MHKRVVTRRNTRRCTFQNHIGDYCWFHIGESTFERTVVDFDSDSFGHSFLLHWKGYLVFDYILCLQQRCHCNAWFKPDLLCINELPHQSTPPPHPTDNLTVQFIEFTYTNDRFPQDITNNKTQKYQPLINNITQQGWKVDPLIVISAGARRTTHTPSMKQLEQTFKLPQNSINHSTFKEINTISIQYANSILIHKRFIENNQAIPTK